ncbi:MAG: DUF1919 domain-containing protein [Candidatus Gastranaerophilales bacterium]|nr:DUF1919 domain-containing protein [Candidatus Gastranaerophilales bacterium]
MLAPLRNKLLKTENFTIISNTCIAIRIYQLVNCSYKTPTVATIILPNDYFKLCSNLKEYMSKELKFLRFEEWMYLDKYHTLCSLGDIEIKFIGRLDFDDIKAKWDEHVKRINYDNLFMVWDLNHYTTSPELLYKFLNINGGTKIIFNNKLQNIPHSACDPNLIFAPGPILEKNFLLTDWLNHDVEY